MTARPQIPGTCSIFHQSGKKLGAVSIRITAGVIYTGNIYCL